MLAVGLMSGTSLDGIDAALVEIRPRGAGYELQLVRFETTPFEAALSRRLTAALPPALPDPAAVASLDAELGAAFAVAARGIAGGERVDYAATHGLTLFHDGPRRLTMQIGRPYDLRDALAATVLFDFRRADCAQGGEGAPLVPVFDALQLGSPLEDRVALNIGGIANLTVLPRGMSPAAGLAFDTGPGNMLLDAFVRMRTGEACDRDGRYARAGRVDTALLARFLADPYFDRVPPKSTGRERFGVQWFAAAPALTALSLEDGCATLLALTVHTIAGGIERYAPGPARVIASGGGARNPALLDGLRAALPHAVVETSDALGIDADAKEAVAFTVLGYETLRQRPADLTRVTGARAPVLLGAIAPHDLGSLLAKLAREMERAHG